MANFDDILKSKIDAFDAKAQPSATELNRLNSSLDLIAQRGMSWKTALLYLLLFLILFSQAYLVYTNWLLNKKVHKNEEIIDLLSTEIIKHKEVEHWTSNEKNGANQKNQTAYSGQASSALNGVAIDSQKIAEDYLDKNEELINRLLSQIAKTVTSQSNQVSLTGSNTGPGLWHSTANNHDANWAQNATEKKLRIEARHTGNETELLGNNANAEQTANQDPPKENFKKTDTFLVKEIVVDSSLYDSLMATLALQKKEKIPAPKIPKEIAWTAAVGFRPSYSNLYLLDGRMVYDFNAVSGFNYNNRWAINAGIKYRVMNVHDHIVDSAANPVANFDQFKAENFQVPFELEGKAHGFYVPIDLQYFFSLGNFNPYVRAGLDLNIYTSERYKIEQYAAPEFILEQTSRRMQSSSYSLGLGGTSPLGKRFSLEYEGGYLIGRSMDPILLSDKNGIYVQARIVYVIKRG